MGLDFMRERAKTFRKSWNRGGSEIATRNLFTKDVECQTRSVIADIDERCEVTSGEEVVLQQAEGQLEVWRETRCLGVVTSPPSDLAEIILASGGVALGRIDRVNKLSATVGITVS